MLRNFNSTKSNSQLDKAMSEEEFNQIEGAIISGKYSWACLLILRFSGYNPLHYIPRRTYYRLMKANQGSKSQLAKDYELPNSGKFKDLDYLEEVNCSSTKVKGSKGFGSFPIMTKFIWLKCTVSSLTKERKYF